MTFVLRSPTCLWAVAFLAMCGAGSVGQAAVMTYKFENVTNWTAANVATGESQMYVQVTDVGVGSNQAKFIFWNYNGLNASSITDVYFDDGSLLNLSTVIDGFGTDFAPGASPSALPFGSLIDWNANEIGTHFDSDSESVPNNNIVNGVNPGEYVSVVFTLIGGQDFTDVITAINLGLANPGVDVIGGLRIGIQVQGFASGPAESFVNTAAVSNTEVPVLPEPASMTVWGLGLALCGGVGYWRKRRQKAAA